MLLPYDTYKIINLINKNIMIDNKASEVIEILIISSSNKV